MTHNKKTPEIGGYALHPSIELKIRINESISEHYAFYAVITPVIGNHAYTIHVWSIEIAKYLRIVSSPSYFFSIYERGILLCPATDVRFKATYNKAFGRSKSVLPWGQCWFDTLPELITFINSCAL